MPRDHLAELVLVEVSRAQREEIDRLSRWLLVLLDAGVPYDEAGAIVADLCPAEQKRAA